jgi:REP element-mobilizing transposase RayT
MHLVLRSTLARGVWSFVRPRNRDLVNRVLSKHAAVTGVELKGIGNAGNHLHLRIKVSSRKQYFHFIRAVAGELALKIKKTPNTAAGLSPNRNFWDRRPFSSIVSSYQYAARLMDYIKINELEGHGHTRAFAKLLVQKWRDGS